MDVAIINTRVANLASVVAGIKRTGKEPFLTSNVEDIKKSPYVILPGVGTFKAGMDQLESFGLVQTLQERIQSGLPTLSVCLGMQLLFEESEESPGVKGLSLFKGSVKKFPEPIRVPQFGWNQVIPEQANSLLTPGYAYFANSYYVQQQVENAKMAYSDYGINFVAAFEYKKLLACQFHPELSSSWGQELLNRWTSTYAN